jgi:hypothetical protein
MRSWRKAVRVMALKSYSLQVTSTGMTQTASQEPPPGLGGRDYDYHDYHHDYQHRITSYHNELRNGGTIKLYGWSLGCAHAKYVVARFGK